MNVLKSHMRVTIGKRSVSDQPSEPSFRVPFAMQPSMATARLRVGICGSRRRRVDAGHGERTGPADRG